MKTRTIIFLATISLMAFSHSAILVNGDFEDEPNYGNNGDGGYSVFVNNQIPGWTIESGHSATIHNTWFYPTISGGYSLNTDGEGLNGHNIDMWQEFSTTAGQQYVLDYDWLGWVQSLPTLDVRVERVSDFSTVVDDQHDWDSLGVHHQSLDFFGDGSTFRVRIFHNPESGFNDNTFIVDNVSVEAVPEPASLTALAVAVAALIRRKK